MVNIPNNSEVEVSGTHIPQIPIPPPPHHSRNSKKIFLSLLLVLLLLAGAATTILLANRVNEEDISVANDFVYLEDKIQQYTDENFILPDSFNDISEEVSRNIYERTQDYEYKSLTDSTYAICAVFKSEVPLHHFYQKSDIEGKTKVGKHCVEYTAVPARAPTELRIVKPQKEEVLCYGREYLFRWVGPYELSRVSLYVMYPQESNKSNQGDYLRHARGDGTGKWDQFEADEQRGIFRWKVGETNGNNDTPPGEGYTVVLNGFLNPATNDSIQIVSHSFNIVNCDGVEVPPPVSIQEVEFITPQGGAKLCLGQEYNIRWLESNPLEKEYIMLYTPGINDFGSPFVYIIDEKDKDVLQKNVITWIAGETKEGVNLPASRGYKMSLLGTSIRNSSKQTSAFSGAFSLVDCENSQEPPDSIPEFKNQGGRLTINSDKSEFCKGDNITLRWTATGAVRRLNVNLVSVSDPSIRHTTAMLRTDLQASRSSGTSGGFAWTAGEVTSAQTVQDGQYYLEYITGYEDGEQITKTEVFSLKTCSGTDS